MAKLTSKYGDSSFYDVTVRAIPADLIKLYGKTSPGDKTNFEWELETTGGVYFTLYDWKESYPDPNRPLDFHIGAASKRDSLLGKAEVLQDLSQTSPQVSTMKEQKVTKLTNLASLIESHYNRTKGLTEGAIPYSKEERNSFLQEMRSFSNMGQHVYRSKSLAEVITKLGQLVEVATQVNLAETEQWMDQLTVKRHNKKLMESYKLFERTGQEIGVLQQRLESCYEDMAEVFNKYYDI